MTSAIFLNRVRRFLDSHAHRISVWEHPSGLLLQRDMEEGMGFRESKLRLTNHAESRARLIHAADTYALQSSQLNQNNRTGNCTSHNHAARSQIRPRRPLLDCLCECIATVFATMRRVVAIDYSLTWVSSKSQSLGMQSPWPRHVSHCFPSARGACHRSAFMTATCPSPTEWSC